MASTTGLTTIEKFAVAKTNEISSEQMELRSENQELKTGLLYFAQDARTSNAQDFCKVLSQCAIYVQDLRKIVVISSMHNICARFAQDCTYFLNAQYMRKICTRLYFFLQCAIYAQDCSYFSNAHVVISSMHNICARFAQDCTSFSNVQYMRKIVVISPMRNICARL